MKPVDPNEFLFGKRSGSVTIKNETEHVTTTVSGKVKEATTSEDRLNNTTTVEVVFEHPKIDTRKDYHFTISGDLTLAPFSRKFVDELITHVPKNSYLPERIIRNGPALIVHWKDGTKTVVKCHDEEFDFEKGLAMALARKLWGRSRTISMLKKVEEQ